MINSYSHHYQLLLEVILGFFKERTHSWDLKVLANLPNAIYVHILYIYINHTIVSFLFNGIVYYTNFLNSECAKSKLKSSNDLKMCEILVPGHDCFLSPSGGCRLEQNHDVCPSLQNRSFEILIFYKSFKAWFWQSWLVEKITSEFF